MTQHVLASHYDNEEQAYGASKLGVWLFLVTEILLFGGLFVTYIVYRAVTPEIFHEGSHHLNRILGAVNTVVLICSSFTMAMAVHKTQHGDRNRANQYLLLTLFFAACFMIVKYVEYTHKFHEGLLPGTSLFFSLYFMMTGLHGIHVAAGMGLIAWVLIRSNRGHFGPKYYTPVEMTGIYWHLVDLIWIYLFPLLYLIG